MGWFSCSEPEDQVCASCAYMLPNKTSGKLYYCDRKCEYRSANGSTCGYYCKKYDRSSSEIKNMRENGGYAVLPSFRHKSDEPKSMASMVCDIAGVRNKGGYILSLENFRNNVLANKEQFNRILETYDNSIGIIETKIRSTEREKIICNNLFNLVINELCKLIGENKIDEAIDLYMTTIKLLMESCGIEVEEENKLKPFNGKTRKKVLFSE